MNQQIMHQRAVSAVVQVPQAKKSDEVLDRLWGEIEEDLKTQRSRKPVPPRVAPDRSAQPVRVRYAYD